MLFSHLSNANQFAVYGYATNITQPTLGYTHYGLPYIHRATKQYEDIVTFPHDKDSHAELHHSRNCLRSLSKAMFQRSTNRGTIF